MSIKHKKHSQAADNAAREINPSDWNADHDVDGAVGAVLPLLATPNTILGIDGDGKGRLVGLSLFMAALLNTADLEHLQTVIGSVAKTGDTMTGDLAMGGHKVTGLGPPSASTDAVNKAYVDGLVVGASGGFFFKGLWDASAGTFPGGGAAQPGWFYLVSVAGEVNGVSFDKGDSLYATAENASSTTFALNWARVEGNITLEEIQAIVGFSFGSLASQSSVTTSQISDASANARSLIAASDFAAMRTLLGIDASSGVQPGVIQEVPYNEPDTGFLECDGSSLSTTTYAALFAKLVKKATATIAVGASANITWTNHNRKVGDPIKFGTTGALPTGLVAGTTYYVQSVVDANTFKLAATVGGAAITTSGTQSGAHTAIHAPSGYTYGASTFTLPDHRGEFKRGWDHGRGVDAGRVIGSAQSQDVQPHVHPATGIANGSSAGGGEQGFVYDFIGALVPRNLSITVSANSGSETRPRNVASMYQIKY